MAWIKRNLFFFIGGLVALGLLGAAGYYNYTSWSRNAEKFDKLNEIYSTLKDLTSPDKWPGEGDTNKTVQARDQDDQLKAWLTQAQGYFHPIAPIPAFTATDPVTDRTFAAALTHTVETLQHEATAANVELPPQYEFSFQAESSLVQFSPGSLDALAVQMGEVKTIAEILYAAGINNLDGIERVHVSDNDNSGPPSDFVAKQAVTTKLAVITPYVVTFRSFSTEIAQVFSGFAGSPHGFLIKSINVQPAGADAMANNNTPPPGRFGMPPANPGYGQPAGSTPGKSGMVTVLKEQLLRVSMEVDIIKLLPKN